MNKEMNNKQQTTYVCNIIFFINSFTHLFIRVFISYLFIIHYSFIHSFIYLLSRSAHSAGSDDGDVACWLVEEERSAGRAKAARGRISITI